MLREQPHDQERSVRSHPTSKGRRGHPSRDRPGETTQACKISVEKKIVGKKFKLGKSLGQEAQD